MRRRAAREVRIGRVVLGGGGPVAVQTMTNTPTADGEATLTQALRVEAAGADIVRVSVPDEASVPTIGLLKRKLAIPVVADIHFDWRLAVRALEAGADKVRINPGTIGPDRAVREILAAARERGAAIRLGLNAASLPRRYRGLGRVEGLLEAAAFWIGFFEDAGFTDTVVSAKASHVLETIAVYRALAERFDYPLHVGVTEAGTAFSGSIKSAVALGVLLEEGIGDTIRVSLSADPELEVRAGIEILKSLGLRVGPELVSCPTCARAEVDVIRLAEAVEQRLAPLTIPITVAVMGCAVNGPGEARDADVGIAGTARGALIFRRGEIVRTVAAEEGLDALMAEIDAISRESEEAE